MENIDEIKKSLFAILYLIKKLDIKLLELQKLMNGEKPIVKYKKANLIEKSITLDFK